MEIAKPCSKCGDEKKLSEFSKGRKQCKKCISDHGKAKWIENRENNLATKKIYREKNRESIREKDRLFHKNNREERNAKSRTRSKKYREEHPEKRKESCEKYRDANIESIREKNLNYYYKNRETIRNNIKQRKTSDLKYKLKIQLQSSFYRTIKRNYSSDEIIIFKDIYVDINRHIEHLTKSDYWNNFCDGEDIQIDHIIPVSAYNFNDHEDIKKCWNPDNLRLLPAKENNIKHNKIDYDLIKKHNIMHLLPESLKSET